MTTGVKLVLLVIVILSAVLRFYKLDTIPPALSWDEVAVGYNAYTIANWGRDEWGKVFPLVFTSFKDDKHPVHIYITSLFVKLYGMKQTVEFVKAHPEYNQVFVTDIRSQPYIFFLYYLKTPLPGFLETVIYTRDIENRKYNLVSIFDKYYFGGWDPIESIPYPGVLYVLSPSQYDGLKHRSDFTVKKVIHFPDGGDAFFLVSAK